METPAGSEGSPPRNTHFRESLPARQRFPEPSSPRRASSPRGILSALRQTRFPSAKKPRRILGRPSADPYVRSSRQEGLPYNGGKLLKRGHQIWMTWKRANPLKEQGRLRVHLLGLQATCRRKRGEVECEGGVRGCGRWGAGRNPPSIPSSRGLRHSPRRYLHGFRRGACVRGRRCANLPYEQPKNIP